MNVWEEHAAQAAIEEAESLRPWHEKFRQFLFDTTMPIMVVGVVLAGGPWTGWQGMLASAVAIPAVLRIYFGFRPS